MAKTKQGYIFASFLISCLATVLAIVAIATEGWLSADLKPNYENIKDQTSVINFGLFSGTNTFRQKTDKISIGCIFSENICAFSDKTGLATKQNEIQQILDGVSCIKQSSKSILNKITNLEINDFLKYVVEISKEEIDETLIRDRQRPAKMIDFKFIDVIEASKIGKRQIDLMEFENRAGNSTTDKKPCDATFINAGLWLTSLLFLCGAIALSAATSALSVLNTATNPVSPWANVWGLHVWNGAAAGLYLMGMVLWGALYGARLSYNVGLVMALQGQFLNGGTAVGYSYWMILAPLFLHLTNISLLYFRQYLIDKEPHMQEDKTDLDRDGMIFVY